MAIKRLFPQIGGNGALEPCATHIGFDKWVTPAHNPALDYEHFGATGTEGTPQNAIVGVPVHEIAQRIAAMRGRSAYVYLGVYQGPDGLYVKVGMSNHPEKRQQSGGGYCPLQRLQLWIADARTRAFAHKLEREVLLRYKKSSVRGEWLRFADKHALKALVAGASHIAETMGLASFTLASSSSPAP